MSLHFCSTSLLKTLWEKEKLLVISNLSFSPSVCNHFGELTTILINLKLSSANSLTLSQTSPGFYVYVVKKSFENTVGKGEISPFTTVFSTLFKNFLTFLSIQNFRLRTPSVWRGLKNLLFGKGLSSERSKICCLGKG